MKCVCAKCHITYSVRADKPMSGSVYICQDCSERALARIQKRQPRLIYDERGYATVIGGYNDEA